MMYVTLKFRIDILIVNYKLGIHCISGVNSYKTNRRKNRWMGEKRKRVVAGKR